jgi:capsular polysaccharide biosynthesis protein
MLFRWYKEDKIVEETRNLKVVLNIIKERLLLIIGLTILGVSLAIILSFYILKPVYEAQSEILVNQKGNSEEVYSLMEIETDLQLINTYNDIITTPFILMKVIEELQLDTTPEKLSSQITLSRESNSMVFKIKVEDLDPVQAVNIANTTAEVFKDEIPFLMNVDNINILSTAKLSENPSPIKPNIKLNIASGAIIGFMLGIGIVFLLETLDTTIKDEKDVEEVLGIPIMGLVGSFPREKKKFFIKPQNVRGN